jgi:hypothetical protein
MDERLALILIIVFLIMNLLFAVLPYMGEKYDKLVLDWLTTKDTPFEPPSFNAYKVVWSVINIIYIIISFILLTA